MGDNHFFQMLSMIYTKVMVYTAYCYMCVCHVKNENMICIIINMYYIKKVRFFRAVKISYNINIV